MSAEIALVSQAAEHSIDVGILDLSLIKATPSIIASAERFRGASEVGLDSRDRCVGRSQNSMQVNLTCRLSSDQVILGKWTLPDWSSNSVV